MGGRVDRLWLEQSTDWLALQNIGDLDDDSYDDGDDYDDEHDKSDDYDNDELGERRLSSD